MTRIVVIGAGVMGASVAYRMTLAGASITVLEAGRIGGGTSSCSFAWTNSNSKTPRAYHELNVAGMKAHAALADELGATPWWHGGGNVEWTLPEQRATQQANVERLQSWGYAAEWITPAQLLELEPDIDPALIGDAPIAYFPEEGWLDPVVYVAAMLGAARSHGASVISGVSVSESVVRGGRVTGVKTADGRLFEADMVVNCAGRWANDPVSDAGLHLPLAPTVGFLVQLIKNTSLASIIGLVELSRRAQLVNGATYAPFVVYGVTALLYFCLCFPLTRFSRTLERRRAKA